jgi:hypothetical protein
MKLFKLSLFLLLISAFMTPLALSAEENRETSPENPPEASSATVPESAMLITMTPRILDGGVKEVWSQKVSRVTLLGKPAMIEMKGVNVVIAVFFTPYRAEDGSYTIIAQTQIGADAGESSIQYQYSIVSIPVNLGETIYFFPLGNDLESSGGTALIEMELSMNVYTGSDTPQSMNSLNASSSGNRTNNTP